MNIFDKRYNIVDNLGNYYMVNERNELVVVEEDETVQEFGIVEANKYINASDISKCLRTVLSITGKSYKYEQGEFDVQEFDMEDIDFVELAKKLDFIRVNIRMYKNQLNDQQAVVDEEICDILHYIELYQCDSEKSFELLDRIRYCRQKRREKKDEYYKVETFSRIFNTGGMANVLKDIIKRMKNMETRDYIPRRLPQLFVQGVKLVDLPEDYQNNFANEYMEENMAYEKQETVFDGRKNDWKSMAEQQAEFFENAGQYIVNLQIDIDDVDLKIEDLMLQCEDANCNVAQGYKMFKQLKELRLQRKEKVEELNKVKLVADCFDCGAMADVYRYCVETISGLDIGEEIEAEPIYVEAFTTQEEASIKEVG